MLSCAYLAAYLYTVNLGQGMAGMSEPVFKLAIVGKEENTFTISVKSSDRTCWRRLIKSLSLPHILR